MREAIRKRLSGPRTTPSHVGLAYTTLAPVVSDSGADGRGVPAPDWLAPLGELPPSPDYAAYVEAWLASFSNASARAFALTFSTRLLVGHGNASGSDVGLTVHHTWGTPIVPGSSLKGIVAHHLASTYDLDTRREASGARDPRWIHRALFGATAADNRSSGDTRGLVTFHDALYRGLAPPTTNADHDRRPPDLTRPPFAPDVLTVHQRSYYNSSGNEDASDHDSPNPVAFLSVRPRARFAVMLEGPHDWTLLAGQLLAEALASIAIGGKGAAGYGRATLIEERLPAPPPSALITAFASWLAGAAGTLREQLIAIELEWLTQLLEAPAHDRAAAARLIQKRIASPKLVTSRDALCARLLT